MAAKEKESKALPEGQAEYPKKGSKVKRIVILRLLRLHLRMPQARARLVRQAQAVLAAPTAVRPVMPGQAVLAAQGARVTGALNGRAICRAAVARFCHCRP